MMTAGKLTREQFKVRQLRDKRALEAQKKQVLICAGTGCIAGGSLEIYDYIQAECQRRGMEVHISLIHEGEPEAPDEAHDLHLKKSGCHGFCEMGPLLQIEPDGILYTHVHLEDCDEIIEKTLLQGELIPRLLYQLDGVTYAKHEEIPFYHKQQRVVLENCGTTDAEDIDEYIARDGYSAFEQALFEMTDEAICKEISDSGLRGRGGGGFPAGQKWDGARKQKSEKKYIVCNGDEGDPGAFMDRSCMEGDPHKVIEGMIVAGVATGSTEGYIYVRAEYPMAVHRLTVAIEQAKELGLLGDNILGTDFCFHLHVNRGAGAFVCGEGSALAESIGGHAGRPRMKPPFIKQCGVFHLPTCVNNVESLSLVAPLLLDDEGYYKSQGTPDCPGTKMISVCGNVKRPGVFEVPFGITIREIVYDLAGGMESEDYPLRLVQLGGASGRICSPAQLDTPYTYKGMRQADLTAIGSGAVLVVDERTSVIGFLRMTQEFFSHESCGQCTPCREGNRHISLLLDKVAEGTHTAQDIATLKKFADIMSSASLCGLGETAQSALLSCMKRFPEVFAVKEEVAVR